MKEGNLLEKKIILTNKYIIKNSYQNSLGIECK